MTINIQASPQYQGLFELVTDTSGTGLVDSSFSDLTIVSGNTYSVPALFSLLISGSGNLSISTINAAGSITANAFSYVLDSAENVVKTFMAEDVAAITATFDGNLTVSFLGK